MEFHNKMRFVQENRMQPVKMIDYEMVDSEYHRDCTLEHPNSTK